MSATSRKDQRLVIGGTPYADLLPPEIKEDKVAARQRSNLIAGLILVVFLVAVGYGAATFNSVAANVALVAAQERSDNLLAEQAKYSEVRGVQGQLAAATASLALASAVEVDWGTFLSDFIATMPEGTSIESVSAAILTGTDAAASPIYQQGSVEIIASVTTPSLLSTAEWLDRLKSLPGFLDVQPTSATMGEEGYTVNLAVHLGTSALWARYGTPSPTSSATPAPTETPTTSTPAPTEEPVP